MLDFSMQLDTLWVLLGAALVFVMQAGFAMVETGFTRAKNAGNIIMKNLMDFAIGSVVFYFIGYGLMYMSGNGFVGGLHFFIQGDYDTGSIPMWAHVAFNTMFCATAATIVSGAMAERTKFSAYIVYSAVISLVIYPISGHWIWGGGWLSELSIGKASGFIDYAGSTAVHMVGGIAALIGAKMLGPRIGKYVNGKPKAILGHSITLGALGVFILWFGWFGFNPASSYGLSTEAHALDVSNVFMTTNIAAACSTVAVMIITWIRYKKPDVSMTLNGSLAGLVAITAGCSVVDPWAAAVIGLLAGFVVVFGIEFIDKVLKIDDPVGAIGVHCFCGAFGTLCVGLFARDTGLFTTGDAGQLAVQAVGMLSVAAWTAVTIGITFFIINKTIGLRVSREEEIQGLDSTEHGLASGYADFMPAVSDVATSAETAPAAVVYADPSMSAEEPVPGGSGPVIAISSETGSAGEPRPAAAGPKMTKIVMIVKQSKFDELKNALSQIGITGMTVTQVLGFGSQYGSSEFYRGVKIDSTLLPKVKIELVVCKVPVSTVIDTAKKVLYTGNIGDGKIFVYDVENVVKVRTGEEGYDALQDVE